MFQTKFVEEIKTHILCSTIFPPENRAVCETMWKKQGTDKKTTEDDIIRHMRFACRKAETRIQTHNQNM